MKNYAKQTYEMHPRKLINKADISSEINFVNKAEFRDNHGKKVMTALEVDSYF